MRLEAGIQAGGLSMGGFAACDSDCDAQSQVNDLSRPVRAVTGAAMLVRQMDPMIAK
jgi:hypothetical protein